MGTPGGTTRSCARPWGCGGGAPGVSGGFWGFQEVLGTHPGAQHVAVLCQHGGADDSPLVLRALEMGVREQEKQLGELGGNGGSGGSAPHRHRPYKNPPNPTAECRLGLGKGTERGLGAAGMCTGGGWGCVEGFFWGSGSAGGTQRGPGGSGVSPGRRWGRHFRGSQGKEGGRCFIGSQGCGGGLKAGSEDTGISGSGGEALWVWGGLGAHLGAAEEVRQVFHGVAPDAGHVAEAAGLCCPQRPDPSAGERGHLAPQLQPQRQRLREALGQRHCGNGR